MEHEFDHVEDRCCCGAQEVFYDSDESYGCMTGGPWQDVVRRMYGVAESSIVSYYRNHYGVSYRDARAMVAAELEDLLRQH